LSVIIWILILIMFAISMVIINQSNNPVYAQVQPSNFTSNNDTGVQSYTYENGQNEIIKAEPKPAPIVASGTTSNDTQIREAVNEVFNTNTTESFNSTDSVSTKIYKQIKSALDMPLNTLTNMGVRLASDREKVYAKLALNNEIKAQVENLMMKDLMLPNTNSVAN
jgi:hypothetical protein